MSRRRRKKIPTEPFPASIESLSHDGRGIAHVEGKITFIHGALPGEKVMFTYSSKRSKLNEGVVQEIIEASSDRVEAKCTHFGVCGGCALQHQSSVRQIESKQETLLDALKRLGKVEPVEVLPPLRLNDPWGYRRKARLGVRNVPKKGKVLVGFRERGSSFVADLNHCLILHPRVGNKLEELSRLIGGLSINNLVPQIEVSMGDEECVLVFRIMAPLDEKDRESLLDFGDKYDFQIWIQEGGADTIRPLRNDKAVKELLYHLPDFNLNIHFRPDDFTQVNFELNRLMVRRAMTLLDPRSDDRILDLFCGLGNFTLPLARTAREVVGVEGNAGLVQRARLNAQRNGINNTRYYTTNLYESLLKEPWMLETFDKALIDPPRSGALEILEYLPKLGIQHILYVSCYPATLARDADELVNRHGYKLISAGVMDMFPHTAHVESIALFER